MNLKKRMLSGLLAVVTVASMMPAIGASAEHAAYTDVKGASSVQLIFGRHVAGFSKVADIPDWTFDAYHPGGSTEVVVNYLGWVGTKGKDYRQTVIQQRRYQHKAPKVDLRPSIDRAICETEETMWLRPDSPGVVNCGTGMDVSWNAAAMKNIKAGLTIQVYNTEGKKLADELITDTSSGSAHIGMPNYVDGFYVVFKVGDQYEKVSSVTQKSHVTRYYK